MSHLDETMEELTDALTKLLHRQCELAGNTTSDLVRLLAYITEEAQRVADLATIAREEALEEGDDEEEDAEEWSGYVSMGR